jgi:16S rRNA (adenine1518-N6/adenine1519-N6)-dimethyltransferase
MILQKHNIHPKKYMGQNFLIDENILNKIIDSADLSTKDTVLEIGPGLGILTAELAKKTKRVIAIEKDKKMCEILKDVLKEFKNIEIVNEDILKIEPAELSDYKIVANIPYYLTSPLIRKFLEAKNKPSVIVLMIQKEVAQRITAKPPHMNILSIAVQFYAEPKIIDYVPKNSFFPVPKVDSAIIKIIPKQIPEIDTEKFFTLVKKGFSAKRKMLKNNIPEANLKKAGLNPEARAENLSIDNWMKIYRDFYS